MDECCESKSAQSNEGKDEWLHVDWGNEYRIQGTGLRTWFVLFLEEGSNIAGILEEL